MKTLNTPEDLKRLKVGESARLGKLRFRLAENLYDEEEYRCQARRYLFYAQKAPKFCPGCGARFTFGAPRRLPGGTRRRWNGKAAAAAVEEG